MWCCYKMSRSSVIRLVITTWFGVILTETIVWWNCGHSHWHLKYLLYGEFILNLMLCGFLGCFFYPWWVTLRFPRTKLSLSLLYKRGAIHEDILTLSIRLVSLLLLLWKGGIFLIFWNTGNNKIIEQFILILYFFGGVLTDTSSCCFTFCPKSFLKIYTLSVIVIVNYCH